MLLLRVLRSVRPVLTAGPDKLLPGSHSGKAQTKKRKKGDDDDEEEEEAPADEVTDEEDAYLSDDGDYSKLHTLPNTNTFTPPKKPGTLLITLLDQAPYSLWSLRALAIRPPHVCPGTKLPQPKYKLIRSFRFDPATYPGYAHRRTLGFKEGVSKSGNEEILGRKGEARTWEFAPSR
jgi:25S rRNA (uracil2634-N3)-methyltransferase